MAVDLRLVVLDFIQDEDLVEGAEEHLEQKTRKPRVPRVLFETSPDLLGADKGAAEELELANGTGGRGLGGRADYGGGRVEGLGENTSERDGSEHEDKQSVSHGVWGGYRKNVDGGEMYRTLNSPRPGC